MNRCLVLILLFLNPVFAAAPMTLLVLGDSLSSAYGLSEQEGWVALLDQRLADRGHHCRVINASIAGDTTANGLKRLDAALARYDPDIVIVELGGNDGLRAQPVKAVRDNLVAILSRIREQGAKIVLAGIRLPPNYGPGYVQAFEALYPELAERFDAALIPFFMEGVAAVPRMMQADGIHPNAAAQPVLMENVWRHLEPILVPSGEAAVGVRD